MLWLHGVGIQQIICVSCWIEIESEWLAVVHTEHRTQNTSSLLLFFFFWSFGCRPIRVSHGFNRGKNGRWSLRFKQRPGHTLFAEWLGLHFTYFVHFVFCWFFFKCWLFLLNCGKNTYSHNGVVRRRTIYNQFSFHTHSELTEGRDGYCTCMKEVVRHWQANRTFWYIGPVGLATLTVYVFVLSPLYMPSIGFSWKHFSLFMELSNLITLTGLKRILFCFWYCWYWCTNFLIWITCRLTKTKKMIYRPRMTSSFENRLMIFFLNN